MAYELEEISLQNDYLVKTIVLQKKWIRINERRMWAELCFVTSNAMHIIGPLLLHRVEQQQMKEIVHTMYV